MLGNQTSFFVLTTRGLEHVSSQELASVPGAVVTATGYRRVAVTFAGSLEGLLGLRTVDDVFLELATWPGIGHHREALAGFGERAAALPLAQGVEVISEVRELPPLPGFSVTASFVGRRNYTWREIKGAIAGAVSASSGWTYCDDDRVADLNLRAFVDHDTAYVGLRLASAPLHRRPYKVAHVPGSLKPPVAAALLVIAGVREGSVVLDPCCGAGTIVIEANRMGASALGGDIDSDATLATWRNLAAAGIGRSVYEWDARALPLATGGTQTVVTNLPWGGEVEVDAVLRDVYCRILREIERTLADGGRAVVLADAPEHLDLGGLRLDRQFEISLYGRTPTVSVLDR